MFLMVVLIVNQIKNADGYKSEFDKTQIVTSSLGLKGNKKNVCWLFLGQQRHFKQRAS